MLALYWQVILAHFDMTARRDVYQAIAEPTRRAIINMIAAEVIENQRVVYEHVSAPKHRTTVTFEAQGDKTLLTWHMVFETKEQTEQVVKVFKADIGLQQNVERMNQYLINQQ